ncbi:MAG: WYL domain-containing protein [Bacteroidales bacterium]|nr:WYL domain-containing protein [Bacteroidales bacterium]
MKKAYDQPKVERTLELMKLLSGGAIRYTVRDLAERLGTSERSIYRYFDSFNNVGLDVQRLSDGTWQISAAGRRISQTNEYVHIEYDEARTLCELIEKLKNSNPMKAPLLKKFADLYKEESSIFGEELELDEKVADNLKLLRKAIHQKRCVTLKNYSSANSGSTADRHVEAFKITSDRQSVWCLDTDDMALKRFKLARIGGVEVSNETWMHEREHKQLFTDIFGMSGVGMRTVKLKIGQRAKNLLTEEYPKSKKHIYNTAGENYLEVVVASYEGIGRFVMGLSDDIEIISPEDFKEHIRERARKIIGKIEKTAQ